VVEWPLTWDLGPTCGILAHFAISLQLPLRFSHYITGVVNTVRQSQTLIAGLCLQHLTAVSEARVASLLQPLVDNLNTIQMGTSNSLKAGMHCIKIRVLNIWMILSELLNIYIVLSRLVVTQKMLFRGIVYTLVHERCVLCFVVFAPLILFSAQLQFTPNDYLNLVISATPTERTWGTSEPWMAGCGCGCLASQLLVTA